MAAAKKGITVKVKHTGKFPLTRVFNQRFCCYGLGR